MEAIIKALKDANLLDLPGRESRQILSSNDGASLTVRHVTIPASGDKREFHFHSDSNEYIHVLSGEGAFTTETGSKPVSAGDTIFVPKGLKHFTANEDEKDLVLLCIFETADLSSHG